MRLPLEPLSIRDKKNFLILFADVTTSHLYNRMLNFCSIEHLFVFFKVSTMLNVFEEKIIENIQNCCTTFQPQQQPKQQQQQRQRQRWT
jgi:hypothetical protein